MDADDLVGASVLIGLTFVENDGSERNESYIGRVTALRTDDESFENLEDRRDTSVLIVECHDGETRTFPFNPSSIDPADPGVYELPDGATIENPDYQMLWRVTAPTRN